MSGGDHRARREPGRVVDREVDHRLAVLALLDRDLMRVTLALLGRVVHRRALEVILALSGFGLPSPSPPPPPPSPSPLAVLVVLGRVARGPLAGGPLGVVELLHRLLHRVVAGGHVDVAELGGEVDLADGRRLHGGEGLQQLEQRHRVADVGGRVLGEDVEQLVAVADQDAGRQLLARLAEEVLLARGADEVVVEMAEAHVLERVVPAHPLVAGLDVDLRGPGFGRDVVAAVDVDVDAADRVHRVGEAGEVDVDDVVDLEPGELLDHLEGLLRTAGSV